MLKFNLSTHRVMVDAKTLLIKELNDVYYATEDKGVATDILSYVHLVSQIDSDAPYFQAREDEVAELAATDIWGHDYAKRVDISQWDNVVVAYLNGFDKPENRMLRGFNKKLDQLQTMLENVVPEIEKSINMKTGTFNFVSNTRAITQVMKEITVLMDTKEDLIERIKLVRTKDAKIWGNRKQSILDKQRMKEATRKENKRNHEEEESSVPEESPEEVVSKTVRKGASTQESLVSDSTEKASGNGSDRRGVRAGF